MILSPFRRISVISRRYEGDGVRLSAMGPRLQSEGFRLLRLSNQMSYRGSSSALRSVNIFTVRKKDLHDIVYSKYLAKQILTILILLYFLGFVEIRHVIYVSIILLHLCIICTYFQRDWNLMYTKFICFCLFCIRNFASRLLRRHTVLLAKVNS